MHLQKVKSFVAKLVPISHFAFVFCQKLLSMIPTDEEISAIQEGMQQSPDVTLGSAEQFLLTLSSISELEARLNLWAFKLDYDVLEKVSLYDFYSL